MLDMTTAVQHNAGMSHEIHDQLRKMIRDSGQTRYRISMATGVDQAVLSKFVRGQRDIGIETIDTLAAHFGHELVLRKAKKGQ